MTDAEKLAMADRIEGTLWTMPAYSPEWLFARRAMWVFLTAITGVVLP